MSTTTPPKILISISTSTPILDRSSSIPFKITLEAHTSSLHPIVIYIFNTILHPFSKSLDFEGLSFTDTTTGELAERRQVHVYYRVPERLSANSHGIAELPPAGSGRQGWKVDLTFKRPLPSSDSDSDSLTSETAAERRLMADQTVGLLPGHRYRVGLGDSDYMREVSWWRKGNKAEVFLRGSLSRAAELGPWLEMELVLGGEAEFEVVGEMDDWTEEVR